MILATCPRCSEPVRFPEVELPGDAQARCPWCHEVFSAEDVSAQLPPIVELFDGAGIPIDSMAFAAAGMSSATKSTLVAEESFADHVELEEADVQVADLLEEADVQVADLDDFNERVVADELDEVSELDDVATSNTLDSTAETWTDDGEPTSHQFTSDDTLALDHEPEEVVEFANDLADEEPVQDSSTEDESSNEFCIEEAGPISDEIYEVVPEEPVDFDSTQINHGIARMRVKPKSRGNAKRSNVRTLLGIALGPILALPIAGLIFYVLGTDLGFWPLDGGRSKSSGMRAAPPMDLDHFDPKPINDGNVTRAAETTESSASDSLPGLTGDTSTDPDSLASNRNANDLTTDDNGVSLDRSFWSLRELDKDDRANEPDPKEKSTDEINWGSPNNASVTQEKPAITRELPAKPKAKLNDSMASNAETIDQPLPKKKKTGSSAAKPAIAPPTSEISLAVAQALDQLKALAEVSENSTDWKKTLALTYASIAKVGDSQQPQPSEEVSELLTELKNSDQFNDLAAATTLWLNYPKRTNEGAVLIGRPGSNENGPIIILPTGVEISVNTDSVKMPSGDKVVALGRIESQSPKVVVRLVAVETAN